MRNCSKLERQTSSGDEVQVASSRHLGECKFQRRQHRHRQLTCYTSPSGRRLRQSTHRHHTDHPPFRCPPFQTPRRTAGGSLNDRQSWTSVDIVRTPRFPLSSRLLVGQIERLGWFEDALWYWRPLDRRRSSSSGDVDWRSAGTPTSKTSRDDALPQLCHNSLKLSKWSTERAAWSLIPVPQSCVRMSRHLLDDLPCKHNSASNTSYQIYVKQMSQKSHWPFHRPT